ncbi:hypothetical protein Mesil_1930 [Allomeiothermus silvanus DSM 9946]|uniref:Uncharacterized protein n=1 Tax=Allomeiothermus silvanus (strain ATCC 700542 / DSM 9946 / NBRC 106475 / NCIMB 13440 / VI-R2) TaxID=526227 RepID=D7BGI9_ALLS1|nr:phage tail protein [Allomeiothermus silvanus]ADH63805.1 hypothetical protein Mesil_1930 [Allomeiothermus silvanus DSM 9946]
MAGEEIPLVPVALYQAWLPELAPPWLQGPRGHALLAGWGQALDQHASLLTTAILARFVQQAPEDALNLLGAERGLGRYPEEALGTWRDRVLGAWEFWRWSGTEFGMRTALAQLGYDAAVVPVWTYDATRWSEFDVYIYPMTRSYDGSTAERNRILGVINQVKAAHTRLAKLTYVSFGPLTWDPPGLTWDAPAVWGDTPVQLFP